MSYIGYPYLFPNYPFLEMKLFSQSLSTTLHAYHKCSWELVLVYFSVAVINTDQKEFRGEKSLIYFQVRVCHQVQPANNSGRNTKVGAEAKDSKECCLLA